MRTLVVMAHYDAFGSVAPHALRQMEAWQEVADRLLVVSTTDFTDPEAVTAIEKRAELLRRENYGYDFYSYKVGLDGAGDLGGYDNVVICNDSYVGPVIPWSRVFDGMRERAVDAWGLTETMRRTRHVQSYFYVFRPWVVRSQAFTGFWRAMQPISDRMQVIKRYELGLSTALLDAGFEIGAYLQETEEDRRLARARHVWWAQDRVRQRPWKERGKAVRKLPFEPYNTVTALADRILDGGRLPVMKIDTLRYDPYQLGSERLLGACEARYPEQFAGVREFLERTNAAYPPRPGESSGPATPPVPVARYLGYAR